MAKTPEVVYALVGAGEFAVQKARNVRKVADRKTTQRYYRNFVKRGKTLVTKIRQSNATKRAAAQTRTAQRQVKAAATSVGKAVKADARATKSAASKAANAS